MNEKKPKHSLKIAYQSPKIEVYELGCNKFDFLTGSEEDKDQGEWDPQSADFDSFFRS